MAHVTYITGGARSGKSGFAQSLAERCAGDLLYIATACIGDEEMADRVSRHRAARGERWETLEEPLALTDRLPAAAAGKGGLLLDCITLWLSNLLYRQETGILDEAGRFIAMLPSLAAPLFIVSNEVGSGIVPDNPLARQFRDLAGEVNQRLAAASDEAWLVVSGLPVRLK